MAIPRPFIGTFKVERSENFDEWLKARGLNMIARKMATSTLTNLTKVIKDNGDGTYTMENQTPSKNTSWTFKLGEPFDADGLDGKVRKATITVDGEELVETHVEPGEKQEPTRYKHEGDYIISVGTGMVNTERPIHYLQHLKAGDVVCRRYLKRQ